MDAEDHFARLDDLDRELKHASGVHFVDIDAIDIGADEEAVELTADVRGVRVQAWYDEDGALNVYSEDEGFEDPDDVHAHLNAGDNSEDDLCGLLDEVEWLRSHHGDAGLSNYRDHRHGPG